LSYLNDREIEDELKGSRFVSWRKSDPIVDRNQFSRLWWWIKLLFCFLSIVTEKLGIFTSNSTGFQNLIPLSFQFLRMEVEFRRNPQEL
jgi:hypothetical protein